MNTTMITISWIVTSIFFFLFILSWSNATNTQSSYGSPASSPPYIIGMLLGHGLIPGILWLITYFTAPKVNEIKKQNPTKEGYSGGYSGGHNKVYSSDNNSEGYDGGQKNSNSTNNSDGYNNGDLYK